MENEIDTTKVIKDNFVKAYEMLSIRCQKNIRMKIMYECDWLAPKTFLNKLDGKTIIRRPEIPIIERIFAEYNLDPWTGEYLSK